MFETWGFLLLHVYTPIQHVILRIFILQWCHTTRLLSLLHYIYLTAIITRFEMQCKHMISFSNMIICLSVSAGLLFVMEENFKSCYCFQYSVRFFLCLFVFFSETQIYPIAVRKLWHMIYRFKLTSDIWSSHFHYQTAYILDMLHHRVKPLTQSVGRNSD